MRVQANQNLKKLKLLYVEDEDGIRDTFSLMLGRFVDEIFVAQNGEEGLELFKNNDVDLIISDIRMPKMNGLEMISEIKKLNNSIPTLFTTAFGESEYLKEAIEVGVDGYLIKPIDRNKLVLKLNKIADNLITKKELDNYIKLMKIVFEEQSELTALLDENLKVVFSNTSFKDIFNSNDCNLEFIIDSMQSIEYDGDNILDSLKNGDSIIFSKDDIFYRVKLKKSDSYWLIFLDDISFLHQKSESLKELSQTDELTSLYNRKKLEQSLPSLVGTYIGTIIFDIDNFKMVNDTYGHNAGDDVLRELSATIKPYIRESDLLMRWGGEEFVVILKNLKDIEIAKSLAEKLRVVIENIDITEVGHFSCSFGVSQGFVEKKNMVNSLIKKADNALYISKANGKNQVNFEL